MGIFYRAEAHAMKPHILRKSFADVGLWPWNPQKKLEACEKNSPPLTQPEETKEMEDLRCMITRCDEREKRLSDQILSGLKPAIITSPEKDPGKKCCEQGDVEKYGEKDQDIPNSEKRKNQSVS